MCVGTIIGGVLGGLAAAIIACIAIILGRRRRIVCGKPEETEIPEICLPVLPDPKLDSVLFEAQNQANLQSAYCSTHVVSPSFDDSRAREFFL